jgi:PQQ-like domain
MTLETLQCARCGAPLPIVPAGVRVVCQYCGATYTENASARSVEPLAHSARAPLPAPAPAPHSPTRSWRVAAFALVVVIVLIGAGKATSIFVPSAGMLFQEWYSPPCLVDANGDDVLDVAGRFGSPESWRLGVVDGKTGAPLWSGETHPPAAGLECLSPTFFGIDNTDFKLSLFPAAAPAHALTVPLGDHVSGLGVGKDCISVDMENGQHGAFSLAGQALPACPATAVPQPLTLTNFDDSDNPPTLESDNTRYSLNAPRTGTKFLTLTAQAGGRTLWQSNLRYVKCEGGFRMVLTPSMLVVYATDPTDDHYGVLIGVDPKTGTQRYAIRQDSHWSGNIWNLAFNRAYVIATWGFGLHAYDPQTGERVWHIGGR